MSLVLPMTILAGGAGLGLALLAATELAPAQDARAISIRC